MGAACSNSDSSSSRTDLSAYFEQLIARKLLFFHSFTHILKKDTGQKLEELVTELLVPPEPPNTTTTLPQWVEELLFYDREK